MKKFIFLFILLTITVKANSQFKIGGVVKDQPFTQWMAGARVTLFNSHNTRDPFVFDPVANNAFLVLGVLMPEGNVIAIGFKSFISGVPGKFIEKYNPASNTWSYGTNFNPVRSRAKTVLLPGKNILVMAGFKEDNTNPTPTNQWGYMKITDIYNPFTENWRRLAPMNYYREYHSLPVLVSDGRIIMVGGEGEPGNEPPFSVIEAFKPPYLFRGVRPQIGKFYQRIFWRGSKLTFDVLKTNSVTGVILMSTPSISHFMNCGNNRYIELPFTQTGNKVSTTIPSNPMKVLDGFYHLIVMVDDIPSVSKIIRIEGSLVIGVDAPLKAPNNSKLFLNYPNPFNPSTSIKYELAEDAFVVLKVYDLLGKKVADLVDEKQNAGTYNVEWNASNFPSGIYYYKITTGNFSDTRKMLLIK